MSNQQQPVAGSAVRVCRHHWCRSHFTPKTAQQVLCTACIEWIAIMERASAYRAQVRTRR
jgi:hypothetical protein